MDEPEQQWRCEDRWQTTAVVPLPPGWRSGFVSAAGTEVATVVWYDCPAMLLQRFLGARRSMRRRGTEGSWSEWSQWSVTRGPDPDDPDDTRVVFAVVDDAPSLTALDESHYHGYVGTIGPSDDADEWAAGALADLRRRGRAS